MLIIVDRHGCHGGVVEELYQLEELRVDLATLACGLLPAPRNAPETPILNNWSVMVTGQPSLVGTVDHPCDSRRRRGVAEGLAVLASDFGWARTHSGFYRLGRPVGAVNHS